MKGALDIKEVRDAHSVVSVGSVNQVTGEELLYFVVGKKLCDFWPLYCGAFFFREGLGGEGLHHQFFNCCRVVSDGSGYGEVVLS